MASVVEQISDCILNKECFVLDAGAGSGKTWTLVQALNYVLENKSQELKNNGQKVVCITYTNVAKDEIIERTEHNEMIHVSTIHDFLWECIKRFQAELRDKFKELLRVKLSKVGEELATKTRTNTKIFQKLTERKERYQEAIKILETNKIRINYDNYASYKKGKFSHDDLIVIAEDIFRSYPKIRKIVGDAYPIIFVDEYQDTQEETVSILLDYLSEIDGLVLGFFGDKRQQIYDTGIGEIPSEYGLKLIKKEENFRSSQEVINLLNKLRSDIKQFQPPANSRRGEVLFYYHVVADNFNAKKFIEDNLKTRWRLLSPDEVKILYLTHRFIAKENNYEELYQVHSNNADVLTKNKDNRGISPFTDFLFDIEEIAELYQVRKIQQLLRKVSFKVDSFDSKRKLKEVISALIGKRASCKVKEVIEFVITSKILVPSERMKGYDFEDEEKKEFYDKLMDLDYAQFIRLYQVQQNNTPFSTKHNTKGDEFDNVLVIIDDKSWKQSYNFNDYFSNNHDNEERYLRTSNLFYVVCSRAKNNLAVACVSDLSDMARTIVKEWFGEHKYIEVT
ncbi:MAG: ATP-dependent helicase [Candidatus Saganbacteria bacterium]|nr:ATP-dependent helicase [Candidatus Saganbacteria bacterium]